MQTNKLPDHVVYSPQVIEFVTVVAETCLLLEQASNLERTEFIQRSVKLLPLLYQKAIALQIPEAIFEDGAERFVSEEDYLYVKEQVELILGADDSYLEVFHPDMAISDTPIAAFISEDLADVYQEIKDFAANYQTMDTDVMNDALVVCLEAFGQHWGQKNLNALKALHSIRYSERFEPDEEDVDRTKTKIDRNSFLSFLHDDEEDDNQQQMF
ncbi:MAG: DUF5063 domain-containing protein [Paludibacter sp.]